MLMNPSQTLLYNVVCFALLSQTLLIYAALEMALLLSFCKYYFLLFLTCFVICILGFIFIFDDFVTIVMCANELNDFFLYFALIFASNPNHTLKFFHKYCAGNIHRVIE